jgi:hypothetical protein
MNMANNVTKVTEMLSAPMEQVIVSLGLGIARAQRELDRYAIEIQREIEQDPVLSEAGLQATFYQIPRAELELTGDCHRNEAPAQRHCTGSVGASSSGSSIKTIHFNRLMLLIPWFSTCEYFQQAGDVVPVPPPAPIRVTASAGREVLEIVKHFIDRCQPSHLDKLQWTLPSLGHPAVSPGRRSDGPSCPCRR